MYSLWNSWRIVFTEGEASEALSGGAGLILPDGRRIAFTAQHVGLKHTMPEQLAVLDSECHALLTSPRVSRLIERARLKLGKRVEHRRSGHGLSGAADQ